MTKISYLIAILSILVTVHSLCWKKYKQQTSLSALCLFANRPNQHVSYDHNWVFAALKQKYATMFLHEKNYIWLITYLDKYKDGHLHVPSCENMNEKWNSVIDISFLEACWSFLQTSVLALCLHADERASQFADSSKSTQEMFCRHSAGEGGLITC